MLKSIDAWSITTAGLGGRQCLGMSCTRGVRVNISYVPEEAYIPQAKVSVDDNNNVWAHVEAGPLTGEEVPMGNAWTLDAYLFKALRITQVNGQWVFREGKK